MYQMSSQIHQMFIAVIIIFQIHGLSGGRTSSGWGPWTEWVCSATCGGGGGRRTRICVDPGPNKCRGGKQKFGKCNEQPCPKSSKPLSMKGWTPWMPWECPVTCGGGMGTRSRICEDPDICEGPEEEVGPCAEEPCPVDPDTLDNQLEDQIDKQLKTSKHNIMVPKGETVSVACKAGLKAVIDREYPEAKAKWLKNGHSVRVDGQRIKLESSGDLQVIAAVDDNGIWWCSLGLTRKLSKTVSFVAFGVQNDKPDIEVEMGHQFQLRCLAASLGRLVKGRFDQTWIHNSTTYNERTNVKPEEAEKFKIPSSDYSHSGIWNCRYKERGLNLPTKREWVTNVVRVLVIPPKGLFDFLQQLLPLILTLIIGILLVAVIAWFYWRSLKKKLSESMEEEEE